MGAEGMYVRRNKRPKLAAHGNDTLRIVSSAMADAAEQRRLRTSRNVIDYSSPFSIPDLLDGLDSGKYGSVTKEIEALVAKKMEILNPYISQYPVLSSMFLQVESRVKEAQNFMNHQGSCATTNVIDLEDDSDLCKEMAGHKSVIVIDSDDEDCGNREPPRIFQEVVLEKASGELVSKDLVDYHTDSLRHSDDGKGIENGVARTHSFTHETNFVKDKGVYVGVEEEVDQGSERENDGLDDIWTEMNMALECSKDTPIVSSLHEPENDDMEDCDHSFVLKDDIGYVCRICGVIDRGIETIFEFQYKVKKSSGTYVSESRNAKYKDMDMDGVKFSEDDMTATEICAHPRHMKQMKPHQIEGFNFLISNLVTENPGGCILAHAPGSGKTFMIISFMQSFLAKYPHARPLVVLPKGILAIWKKEFQTWQVEDIPLLDFYSVKADNRSQQLVVLKKWVEIRSILFLGYKQFSTIMCDSGHSGTATSCQEILLKAPSILILDEGHTPRNENTDVLQTLAKVQTSRKVVLSGTLYQNHVKEVFNVLNLVRPKFTRSELSRPIIKRIMSRVDISGIRKNIKIGANASFYDLVEHTLHKDKDFRRKVAVIQDLREMTSKVLHYYKGDFLDELPGLVDFTVVLNLSPKQKHEVKQLKKLPRKFKVSSVGSSIYLHPKLKLFPEISTTTDDKMDEMLDNIDVKDGVKAKFFLTVLNLCEAAEEKLLVFSPYLVPLKFLERLALKAKGWRQGREVFVISGESTSEQREFSMDRFNNSPDAKVFFGSIKACGEGISLVGASRIIVLDVHLNPSVTRQAIGRAFRPGQKKKVFAYRLVAAESPEEEDHSTCFKKELISKMWFEWNEYCGYRDFEVETVAVKDCGDLFLESSALSEDVKLLYKRYASCGHEDVGLIRPRFHFEV